MAYDTKHIRETHSGTLLRSRRSWPTFSGIVLGSLGRGYSGSGHETGAPKPLTLFSTLLAQELDKLATLGMATSAWRNAREGSVGDFLFIYPRAFSEAYEVVALQQQVQRDQRCYIHVL